MADTIQQTKPIIEKVTLKPRVFVDRTASIAQRAPKAMTQPNLDKLNRMATELREMGFRPEANMIGRLVSTVSMVIQKTAIIKAKHAKKVNK